eukprot:1062532-Rhodomonas_salina.1
MGTSASLTVMSVATPRNVAVPSSLSVPSTTVSKSASTAPVMSWVAFRLTACTPNARRHFSG